MIKTIRKKLNEFLCKHEYVVVCEFAMENKRLVNIYSCKKCGHIHKEIIL